MPAWKRYYPAVKWAILALSYGFLAYKIMECIQNPATVSGWNDLSWRQWGWLLLSLIFMPVNLLIESVKWCYLVSDIERLTFCTALKSVMSGYATGFFTPNRLGEYPGRAVYLEHGNRWKAITFGMVGTLAQTIILLLFGFFAFILLMGHRQFPILADRTLLPVIFGIEIAAAFTIYLSLPRLSRFASRFNLSVKVNTLLMWLSTFKRKKLIHILLLAFARYVVFCLQFYFMLRFCSIDINLWQGVVSISTFYMFVTFTPSIAFSEAAIRGSYAVIFVGIFSANSIGIALAGILVWLVNAVIPMLTGSVFFSKTNL
jgi:hypothetical protein